MNSLELRSFNEKRKVYQLGLLVYDIEKSVKKWVEQYHVGPWTILTHSNEYLKETRIHPKAAAKEWKFHVALAMMGSTQIELIQPVYGIPLYEDFMKEHGEGIHHFKEIMSDAEMDRTVEMYQKQGVDILFGGNFYGARFYYPDTIPLFGFQIELGNGVAAQLPDTYTHKRIYPPEDK